MLGKMNVEYQANCRKTSSNDLQSRLKYRRLLGVGGGNGAVSKVVFIHSNWASSFCLQLNQVLGLYERDGGQVSSWETLLIAANCVHATLSVVSVCF